MIGIDIIRKKRNTSGTSGGSVGYGISTPSGGDALNALHADEADHASRADEATHSASAKELDGTSSVWNTIRTWISSATDAMKNVFLRKDQDDSTPFTLGMQNAKVIDKVTAARVIASIAQSDGFKSISDGDGAQGWALRLLDAIATGELDDLIVRRDAKVKDLTVTGAAHFFKLIIDEIKSAGGSVLLTPANGFVAENVTHHGTTGAEDERYILYWKDSDGEKTIDNQWQVGDFAVCMTANLKKGVSENTGNKTWWCKVVDSGNAGGYNYISLDWHGRAQGRTITEGRKTFTEATSSGVPEKGDNVAMLGSVATDKDGNFDYKRQSAIYLAAYDSLDMGIETPFLAFYYGIDDFCLSRHRKTHLSRLATNVVADKFTLRSDDEEYPLSVFFGDWNSETTYPKAGVVSYNGCTWTSLKDGNKGNAPSASSEWWVSNKGKDGDQGYSLHFAYADSVTYSGSTPTVTGFSTTRKDSSEWLGVNRSLEVEDPTDPAAYEWTKIKGADGRDVYRLEVISSAGLVYHNGSLNTVLSAHVWGPDGEVTDRCSGTFTWYDLRVSNPIGTGKTYTAQATSAVDAYHYRCVYNGEVSKETYNVVYNGKQLQYNGKNIQF